MKGTHMKRLMVLALILGFAIGTGAAVGDLVFTASQGVAVLRPTPGLPLTVASCPAPTAGAPQLCIADKAYFSNGGAYVDLAAGGGGTVNNLTIGTKICNLGTAACTYAISVDTSKPSSSVTVQ